MDTVEIKVPISRSLVETSSEADLAKEIGVLAAAAAKQLVADADE